MRVHAHDYRSLDVSGILDGAILMHRQIAHLLTRRQNVFLHDLTRGAEQVRGLRDGDVVYAGSGPYAYLYHRWRERNGVDFRIVREVHTALWSGYWLQEELCAPLVRPGDIALFPTEYTRLMYRRWFPSTDVGGSAVAYPVLDRLPRLPARGTSSGPLRIGYLGALSLAKNFDQVLDVFSRVHRETGGAANLVVAGKPNAPQWEDAAVLDRLARSGVDSSAVRMAGMLRPDELSSFFTQVDVLMFPSTASRETLGRVVLEALAHGVAVLAADVGPAVELLPERNLLPSTLDTESEFVMSEVGPLGRIDGDAAVATLVERDFEPAGLLRIEPYADRTFWQAMTGRHTTPQIPADDRITRALRVAPRTGADLGVALEESAAVFAEYFGGDSDALLDRVAKAEAETGRELPALREIAGSSKRNLADYRALPRLLDGLVLPPLSYRLSRTDEHGK
ncbi:glycosyltransferase [Saccharopolyspora erythraea]|uniref:glycosyltransferase n=1 Tax=Saccharopolyspora erythraea TaxID=1836 RepID=UPI001BADA22C|nr:glycosyltransferase [Saccharopolyspora erythraea]QUH01949.1 glycosyltransferase [Saccharopolyspora erythraea]